MYHTELYELPYSFTMVGLPTLDFSEFTHGSHLDQLKLGNAIVKSFKDHGSVKFDQPWSPRCDH